MNISMGNTCTCTKCSQEIAVPQDGMLQIYRMGNMVGAAAPMSLYINGNPYGHLGNREQINVPLPFGTYKIHMALGTNRKCNDPVAELTPDNPVACFKVHIKTGFIQSTMVVEPADPASMPE